MHPSAAVHPKTILEQRQAQCLRPPYRTQLRRRPNLGHQPKGPPRDPRAELRRCPKFATRRGLLLQHLQRCRSPQRQLVIAQEAQAPREFLQGGPHSGGSAPATTICHLPARADSLQSPIGKSRLTRNIYIYIYIYIYIKTNRR